MFRNLIATSVVVLAAATGLSAQQTAEGDEALAWESIQQSGTSADVFEFLEVYPNGAFEAQARALMVDLLLAELSEAAPEPAIDDAVVEAPVVPEVDPVSFSAPLTQGAPEIVGRSLEELIVGNPLFPPIEGLPESFWKEQECSDCHGWEQANLCEQANTYMTDAGAENLAKPHPYGGTFKQNLVTWAEGGCE